MSANLPGREVGNYNSWIAAGRRERGQMRRGGGRGGGGPSRPPRVLPPPPLRPRALPGAAEGPEPPVIVARERNPYRPVFDDDDDNINNDRPVAAARRAEEIVLLDGSSSSSSSSSSSAASSSRRPARVVRSLAGSKRHSDLLIPPIPRRGRGLAQRFMADDDNDTVDDDDEEEEDDRGAIEIGGGMGSIRSILAGDRGAGLEEDGGILDGDDDHDRRRLHFGMDPTRSYSDWTITIQPTPSSLSTFGEVGSDEAAAAAEQEAANDMVTEQTYHVHKCVLAVGPRRSLYFRRAFDLPFREQSAGASTIPLEPLAAKAFTTMLEFVYNGGEVGSDLVIGTDNAVPLRFLARYFEVPAMGAVVTAFIAKDLSPTNCHIYYRHASIFQDDDMVQAVEALCSIKPLGVCRKNPSMLKVTDLDFWLKIMGTWRGSALRRRSSTVLKHLIRTYRDNFTADRFRAFTDPDLLPVVRGTELAKDLLRMEKELLIGPNQVAEQTNLQERCVEAFARHQRTTGDADSEKDLTAFLQADHPVLLGPFLLEILKHERRATQRPVRPIPPPPLSGRSVPAAVEAPQRQSISDEVRERFALRRLRSRLEAVIEAEAEAEASRRQRQSLSSRLLEQDRLSFDFPPSRRTHP